MKLLDKQGKAEHVEELVGKWCDIRRHDEKRREGWRRHYSSSYDYIEVELGGEKRYVELRKPSIKSEFWYDDEYDSPLTDDPEQRHRYFVAENLRRFEDFGMKEWHECEEKLANGGCCTGRHLSEPFFAVYPSGETYPYFMASYDSLEWLDMRGAERFPMTQKDIEQLGTIMAGQEIKFHKRLETYWKRYSDRVSAHGYWANR